MKKINNLKLKVGLIIGIALIVLVGLHNYRKPIPVQKTFNEAIIVKTSNQEILEKTTISINANLHKRSILNLNGDSRNKLEGTIVIDDKEYVFDGFTQESDNSILGGVYKDNQSYSTIFILKMYDLESIALFGIKEWDERIIVAPAQTIEDCRHILDRP
jgi:hypothetical protein